MHDKHDMQPHSLTYVTPLSPCAPPPQHKFTELPWRLPRLPWPCVANQMPLIPSRLTERRVPSPYPATIPRAPFPVVPLPTIVSTFCPILGAGPATSHLSSTSSQARSEANSKRQTEARCQAIGQSANIPTIRSKEAEEELKGKEAEAELEAKEEEAAAEAKRWLKPRARIPIWDDLESDDSGSGGHSATFLEKKWEELLLDK